MSSSACCSDYAALLQQLQENQTSSGDSFYVRVNISLPTGPNGTLAVSCNDILHVTNTRPPGSEDSWYASQVHPCQPLDLQSGTVPNYFRLVQQWGTNWTCEVQDQSSFLSVSIGQDTFLIHFWCYRAQRLLIQAIEDMSFEAKSEKVKVIHQLPDSDSHPRSTELTPSLSVSRLGI